MPHAFARPAAGPCDFDEATACASSLRTSGGAFGGKAGVGYEHAAVMAAARSLGRPLAWVETRSENLVAMPHGRGQVQWIELGFDADGRITGMHCRVLGDAGAYAGFGGALAMGPTRMMAQGVYRIPPIRYDVAVAVTNTTPMGAFRGAGPAGGGRVPRADDGPGRRRPCTSTRSSCAGATCCPTFTEPVQTVMGTTYDTGDYQEALDEAVRLAGYDDLRAEQAARGGRRAPAGSSASVSPSTSRSPPAAAARSTASVEVHRDGTATIRVGHLGPRTGPRHRVRHDRLGPARASPSSPSASCSRTRPRSRAGAERVGPGPCRSAGSAVLTATEEVLARAKELAAAHLEASVDDIVVARRRAGRRRRRAVAGPCPGRSWPGWREDAETGRGKRSRRTARRSAGRASGDRPGSAAADRDGRRTTALGPLAAAVDFAQDGATFPFGAHVSVVEVDMETGEVRSGPSHRGRRLRADRQSAARDRASSTVASPRGWRRRCGSRWSSTTDGNPLTANLADYAMPSAAEFPFFETANTETPTLPQSSRRQGHR